MALKIATVEVTAKYTVEVMASNGLEAQDKAAESVRSGVVKPDEVVAIIIKEVR